MIEHDETCQANILNSGMICVQIQCYCITLHVHSSQLFCVVSVMLMMIEVFILIVYRSVNCLKKY